MLLRKIMHLIVHQIKLTHFDTANGWGGGFVPTAFPWICDWIFNYILYNFFGRDPSNKSPSYAHAHNR
jgi:hypothetical protein